MRFGMCQQIPRPQLPRHRPKSGDFLDAENRQHPCRMITRHVKDPLSVSVWLGCSQRNQIPITISPNQNSNAFPLVGVVQHPMKAKVSVPISVFITLGIDVHEQLFRSRGQSDAKSPVFNSQASLVLIYRPTKEMSSYQLCS
ncbi:hypothetical protein TNCV_68031 [Trichonephila clavipes]|nr:hypothetical protein TNCV_68031 [Trichonephila clavipes]